MGKAYITRRNCGCINFATAIPDDKSSPRFKELAKELAAALRRGATVETVTDDEVRNGRWGCTVCKPPKKQRAFA